MIPEEFINPEDEVDNGVREKMLIAPLTMVAEKKIRGTNA
jgi:hypothetical protein